MDVFLPLMVTLLGVVGIMGAGLLGAGLFFLCARRMVWRQASGGRIRTTDQVIRAHAKTVEMDADWQRVRALEMECYGAHYHRRDGTTYAAGWEPIPEDEAPPGRGLERRASSFDQALDKVGERTYTNRIRAELEALDEVVPSISEMTAAQYDWARRAWLKANTDPDLPGLISGIFGTVSTMEEVPDLPQEHP